MAEIKNLKKAAQRIIIAIKNEEKIILYGDADLDGVGALIILKETIKNLGGEIQAVYFPDRETEGYGISEIGLNSLKKFARAILIAVDCGITNFKEVKLAKKFGFEVIIIDHHEVLDKLPQASIIVDPKQKGDKYPFKGLATVGVVFLLSKVLLKERLTESMRRNFLELVALSTIADMMPREEDNNVFIAEGLKSLENSWRPGIRAFLETDFFKTFPEMTRKISKIVSILNIRDVEKNLPASFRLLTSSSLDESKTLIARLIEKSEVRRQKIAEITEEVEGRLAKEDSPLVFEGNAAWDFTLISPVASIICQRHQKPTFIYKVLGSESQGTVRVPSEINSVALMKKCSKLLLTFGGHPLASGFRIKNENLEKFKNCLLKNLTT